MRILVLSFLAGWLSIMAAEPVSEIAIGETLPTLRGEFLTGRSAVLPEVASGRVALLLLGFTYDSRFEVEQWAKKFRAEFGKNPKVTFFEVPMIGGMAVMGKWFIDSGMRRGTPKADQENVITVYGGTDIWKQRVGFQDPKAAYLVLIDPTGKVLWKYSGAFDEATYEKLSAIVAK